MNNNNNNRNKSNKKESNQLTSILTAFSIIIVVGTCIYVFLDSKKKSKDSKLNPEVEKKKEISDCPNYFESKDGKCVNVHGIGKCKSEYNFKQLIDNNKHLLYNKNLQNKLKCEWAKYCQVSWDGIDRLC